MTFFADKNNKFETLIRSFYVFVQQTWKQKFVQNLHKLTLPLYIKTSIKNFCMIVAREICFTYKY